MFCEQPQHDTIWLEIIDSSENGFNIEQLFFPQWGTIIYITHLEAKGNVRVYLETKERELSIFVL